MAVHSMAIYPSHCTEDRVMLAQGVMTKGLLVLTSSEVLPVILIRAASVVIFGTAHINPFRLPFTGLPLFRAFQITPSAENSSRYPDSVVPYESHWIKIES